MEERRKYIRIPENSQIFYEMIPGDKMREHVTRDIGEEGIRFLIHEMIPKGSHLKIRLNLQKTFFSFEALVRVMWTREVPYIGEYEVGVKFIDIPPEAAEYLVGYIKSFLAAG